MLSFEMEKVQLKEPILSVYASNDIYIALGNKFINYSKEKILCRREKSVRKIAGSESYIGCCSFDGTATVFDKNDEKIDIIEGPITEIKGIAFYNNFLALTTRGKTTWILEDLEISKILEDHTQDVKGCAFYNSELYTWSYDNTIKIYQQFDIDHSWELIQSIDFSDIVWNIIFYKEYMCVCLQDGHLAILKRDKYIWENVNRIQVSLTPVYTGAVIGQYLGVVCNMNVMLFLDSNFNKIQEIPKLNEGFDVFSCCYKPDQNKIICGSEDGTLTFINLHNINQEDKE